MICTLKQESTSAPAWKHLFLEKWMPRGGRTVSGRYPRLVICTVRHPTQAKHPQLIM